jgi:putative acetyltransferase
MDGLRIRTIEPADNQALAAIIRQAHLEFGVARPGTAYYDSATDKMYETFQHPGSRYHVGVLNDNIVGGAGLFPTDGLPEGTCELVKTYVDPSARGMGLGKKLLEKCMEFALQSGYKQIYLESLPEFETAISMYRRSGFRPLPAPMGNTGHHGCSLWLLKNL